MGPIMIFHDNASRDVHCETQDVQRTIEQLLAELQASEHEKFAAHLYRSGREYRSACERAGKGGKQIERCIISTFQVAESMGFHDEFRQWEHLLRIGD